MSIVAGPGPLYDRKLLLHGAKREAVLKLWEVERYGRDSFGDPDYVSTYGMKPAAWYARGVRVLGRTAVECTRDELGNAIGGDVAALARAAPRASGTTVIDPFAGSGNTLYWLLRYLPGARGLGFEADAAVCRLTRRNFETLGLQVEIANIDYRSGLTEAYVEVDQTLILFVAPPWGHALNTPSGLDLRRTEPPVVAIIDLLLQRFSKHRLLCAIQVYEIVEPDSLRGLQRRELLVRD
jgi:hypothetical protein